jgi:hypothetical protein
LIDETKHCASGGLGIGRYANGRTGADHELQSLMGDGYTVAGVASPPAGGAGLFLQKGNMLVFCFVTEKLGSASLDTNVRFVPKAGHSALRQKGTFIRSLRPRAARNAREC